MRGIFQKGFGVVILIVVVAAVTIVGYSFKTRSSPIEVAKQIPRIVDGWLEVGTVLPGQAVGVAQRTVKPLGQTIFGKTTRMKIPLGDKLVPGGITLGELPFYAITLAFSLALTAVITRWVWRKYLENTWQNISFIASRILGGEPLARVVRIASVVLLFYGSIRTLLHEGIAIAATVGLGNLALVGALFFIWGKIASFFAPKARDILVIFVVIGLIVVFASILPKALRSPEGIMSAQSWGSYAPVATFAYAMTGGFKAEGMLAIISAFLFWIAPKIPTILERGPAET